MANLVSRISNIGVYSTSGISGSGIFDEYSGVVVADPTLVIWLDAGQSISYPGSGTTWYDLSQQNNNATLLGSPVYSSAGQGSLAFSTTSQYASFSTNPVSNVSAGTVMCWVYLTSNTANYIFTKQHLGVNTWSTFSIGNYVSSGGNETTGTAGKIYWHGQNGEIQAASTGVLAINTWYHVAVVFNSTTATFYINGVFDSTTNGNYTVGTDTSPTFTAIGLSPGSDYGLNGSIGTFMYFTRNLSASEIATNYNALVRRYGLTPTANALAVTKRVSYNGTIYINGVFDEITLQGSTTSLREFNNGNITVSGGFDEVTGTLVTNGLIAYIDAGKIESYAGSGTKIFDIVNPLSNPAALNGAVTWISNSAGRGSSYWWWPASASANYISSTLAQNYLDVTIVFQSDFTLNTDGSGLVGLIAASTDATSSDKSMRFSGANGTGPWTLNNPDNTDGWASSATTYYINGVAYTGAGNILSGWNILGGHRTNTTNGAFASNFAYYLGTEGYSGGVRDFRGNIAAVAFYNRTLSAGEQLNNYNYFAVRYGLPYIGPL